MNEIFVSYLVYFYQPPAAWSNDGPRLLLLLFLGGPFTPIFKFLIFENLLNILTILDIFL